MSTKLHDDGRTEREDDRVYPAERAFSTPRDRPAWKAIDPDLSGGWREVRAANGLSPEVFTST
jgi:hypothetical protein